MAGIEAKIDASFATVEMIANQVNSLATNFDTLKAHITSLETRVTQMELNDHHQVANSDFLDEIKSTVQRMTDSNLEVRTLQVETQLLADEITIGGLPEMKNEKLTNTVMLLSKTLKVTVTEADVIKIERLGKEVRAKNRNIRVKFNNQKHVDNVMSNIKRNIVKVGTLIPNAQSPDAPVYINRCHPSALYKLRLNVRKMYPNILAKNIWISYGSVNVRYADNKPPVKLLPSTGLEPLQNLLD